MPEFLPDNHPNKAAWLMRILQNRVRGVPSDSISPIHHTIRLSAIFVLVLLVGMISGVLVERNLIDTADSNNSDFDELDAVVEIIEQSYYYRPTDPSSTDEFQDQLQQSAIMGMLGGLNDDYTTYLAPPDATRLDNQLAGRGVGIGVEFYQDNGRATIARVYPKTPAEENGLRAGDVVLRIDGQPVDPSNWAKFMSTVEGLVGTQVRLTLQRPGQPGSFDVTLVRSEYEVPSVAWRMIEGTAVGWIQIGIFGTKTTSEVDAALAAVTKQGATSVILDLRGNGGGWVRSAQEVLGRFLPADIGPALYEDFTPGRGEEEEKPILGGGPEYFELPLIVLADGNTASAAEIVAGALRDYDRAMVIGERTFGKGSVQRVFDFDNGASLRVTFAEWLTPSKGRIQEEGINPDIQVTVGTPGEATSDPVLDTALQMAQSGRTTPSDLTNIATPET
jgi:carboxyl-terminal processing protease